MSADICRWGILGTANIARKNWKAMRQAGNAVLVAVGSRSAGRANEYIRECQSEVPFATLPQGCTYEELLQREDIDAVYIPLPTGIRKDWVIRAAHAGKHVLCEKPCGTTTAELREIIAACAAKRVQFMDGVMFMHGHRLPLMRAELDRGAVGTIRRISSQFSFAASDEFLNSNIRANNQLEPLGCLGDLGWYNIRFSLWAMQYQLPQAATGRLLTEHGPAGQTVPLEFSGELLYPGGVTASFYCSFLTELQQWAHITGTAGSLYLDDFVLPYYGCEAQFVLDQPAFRVQGTSYHMERHQRSHVSSEYSDGHADSQETNMIRRFSELARGTTHDPFWPEVALKTQLVLDACLQSARQDGRPMPVSQS
ncbi:MAG: Gfo/Idh/MocA family oxidoreductase [Bacteroidales bacterium]|nr:Gfo/Idh/MocA family oxidoreductase [Bacteroidales bacterium]